jgi:hypothetical protein
MRHVFWMLVLSTLVGFGAGLLTAGLVEVVEWWAATAHYQVTFAADGNTRHEYRPSRSGYAAMVGCGTAILVCGVTFTSLLNRVARRVTSQPHPAAGR